MFMCDHHVNDHVVYKLYKLFWIPYRQWLHPFFFLSATETLTQWAIQMLCREGAVNYWVLGPCFSRDNVQRKVWHLMFISHKTSIFGLPFYSCCATCVTLAQRDTSCSGCIRAENCIFGRLIECRAANMATVEKTDFTVYVHHSYITVLNWKAQTRTLSPCLKGQL